MRIGEQVSQSLMNGEYCEDYYLLRALRQSKVFSLSTGRNNKLLRTLSKQCTFKDFNNTAVPRHKLSIQYRVYT